MINKRSIHRRNQAGSRESAPRESQTYETR